MNRSATNKRWWGIAALVVLPLALAFLLKTATKRREQVLSLLRPVPGTAQMQHIDGPMWMGKNSVLCFKSFYESPLVVNTVTGAKTPSAIADGISSYYFGTRVSPNGKWLLRAGSGGPQAASWQVTSLDGKVTFSSPRLSSNLSALRVAWLPDSSGWVEARDDENASHVTVRFYQMKANKFKDVATSLTGVNGIGTTKTGEVIVVGGYSGDMPFRRLSIAHPEQNSQFSITPPQGGNNGQITDIEISPKGDRIAWIFQQSGAGGVTESIWLSDINGKNFHVLVPPVDKFRLALSYMQWTPDGNSLSGWNQSGLVRVPVT